MKQFDFPRRYNPRRTRPELSRCLCLALCALWFLCALNVGAADVRYRVLNLQSTASAEVRHSEGRAINRHGEVAGAFSLPGDITGRPFVYSDGSGFVPLEHPEGFLGFPQSINDHGQVAVFGYVPGTEGPTAWRYAPGVGFESLGTLGVKGNIGDVPNGINNLGQIVGRSDIPLSPWQVAFLYTSSRGMVSIGTLSSNRAATAWAINDAAQITGHSGGQVFLYTETTGMVAIGQGAGFAINSFGVVAGEAPGYEAAIFENGTTRRLGTLGGSTLANSINDYKVVVGDALYFPSTRRSAGFIWSEAEGMEYLELLAEPGWYIIGAWAINNHGQIAGMGYYLPGGGTGSVAVRLDPIPPKLAIQSGTTNLVVSWSPNWPAVVLEATDDLSAPNWQPVAMGGTNAVAVPFESPSRFFRLNLEGLRGLCCPPQP